MSSAVFGMGPIGLTAKSAVLLRQWFHKQLRAVTGSQAFLTGESNAALRERAAVQDPVDALADSVARKLEKLQLKEPDITNTPDIVAHWESCRETFDGLRTTVSTDSIVPAPPPAVEMACYVCGVYFPTVKTMRQHRASKHKVYVREEADASRGYQQHLHSVDGMPKCRHCGKTMFNWRAFKKHIINNACH